MMANLNITSIGINIQKDMTMKILNFIGKKCLKFIESVNNELNNSKYIFDDNISYADIVLLPFMRQFRIADMEWFDKSLPYDNLKKWLSSF